jgi:hypothetical protein
MNDYNFLDDSKITNFILDKMNDDNGFFLGRIGGGDYNALLDYYINGGDINKINFNELFNNVSNFNGYFDKEKNIDIKKKNFEIYLKSLEHSYLNSECLSNPCEVIENGLEINKKNKFNKYICKDKKLIKYYYIEAIMPFLKDFKIFAEGKKVLIISPFSKTIEHQFQYKNLLINNYEYPDFTLLTYNTPITYNNKDDNLDFIKTNNWLEQSELMANEINNIDFDIALLSCGSYAVYLGNFISEKMNKKAIYIGGPLNVFFCIKGERYTNSQFYLDMMNNKYIIDAFEKEQYTNISGGRDRKSEGFKAYF